MVIYETINKINGKRYIGKDKNNDPNYIGSGRVLQKAIKKYGKENFIKNILEYCSTEKELNEREVYWIEITNAQKSSVYYNIAPGGNGGDNITHNPDKQKFIDKMICINRSPRKNTKHTESTKQNQKIAATGRYTLAWFRERYGVENGLIKYKERNTFLKLRTQNAVDANPEKFLQLLNDVTYNTKQIAEYFNVSFSIIYRKLDQWYGCKSLKEYRSKLFT